MRLLFERDLTPHPQYVSFYDRLDKRCDAVVHVGMHGTVEWLPGQALGNDKESWSDVLLGGLPNLYLYAANNPSESILAKRRGYATLVSYLSPPYARAGTYGVLAELKELLADADADDDAFLTDLDELVAKAALENEVPTRGADAQAWVAAVRARRALCDELGEPEEFLDVDEDVLSNFDNISSISSLNMMGSSTAPASVGGNVRVISSSVFPTSTSVEDEGFQNYKNRRKKEHPTYVE